MNRYVTLAVAVTAFNVGVGVALLATSGPAVGWVNVASIFQTTAQALAIIGIPAAIYLIYYYFYPDTAMEPTKNGGKRGERDG